MYCLQDGIKKDPTETEMTLLKEYMSNYIEVRLTNKFIIDVAAPLMKFLDTFEKDEVKIHVRHDNIVDLLYCYSSKYLKNAGLTNDEDLVTADKLIKIKYDDKKLQLSDKDIFLGPLVDEFMAENLRKKWRYIAEKFPNVIKIQEIPQLLEEVRVLKTMSVKEGTSPEEFIADIEMKVDEDSGKVFKLVSKIAKALLSIHNSSSSAERDFSLQVFIIIKTKR